MKKKIKDLTKDEIVNTCKKFSNDFNSKCDKKCPFYRKGFWCKSHYHYMKKNGEEEVEVDD